MDAKHELLNRLMEIPWFREQERRHVTAIADLSTLRTFKAGEVFFKEGDLQDYFYIMLEGRVALDIFVPHRGKVRIFTAEPWDVFGWSSVTPSVRTRTAGAVGVVDGMVICIDAQKLRQACEADVSLGYRVMNRLANVIASRLLVTRLQLLDMFAEPVDRTTVGE